MEIDMPLPLREGVTEAEELALEDVEVDMLPLPLREGVTEAAELTLRV